jgi:hypothetical protein
MTNDLLKICRNWHVYNLQTQKQLGPMSTPQLIQHLSNLGSANDSTILVWCPLWTDWRGGRETLELLGQGGFENLRESSPHLSDEFYSVKRRFPRIPGRLFVTLLAQERSFRTKTTTLSLGGMAFATPIPGTSFGRSCKATITYSGSNVRITASVMNLEGRPTSSPVKYVRFVDLKGSALTTYAEWLRTLENEVPRIG